MMKEEKNLSSLLGGLSLLLLGHEGVALFLLLMTVVMQFLDICGLQGAVLLDLGDDGLANAALALEAGVGDQPLNLRRLGVLLVLGDLTTDHELADVIGFLQTEELS